MPFFSIRKKLSDDFLKEPKDPATLMLSLVKEEKASLTVNLKICKIIYKTIEQDLMPARMALYAFFIVQKKTAQNLLNLVRTATNVLLRYKQSLKNRPR